MSSLGATIERDFEVREYLGKSGKVLRAYQRALQREVVLKICNPKFYDPAQARAKFIEAGRMLGALRHPNVVQVYGVETPEGEEPFLVMEWVEGTSLKKILKEERRLSYDRALGYAEGILAALEGIHEQGVIHRNLKPENLLVDTEGEVKLVDFGLALSPDQKGEEEGDVVLGTPIYMSPEQVRGKPLDTRSDLYAAGVILYEMVCGKAPFTGKDPRAIMRAHVKKPVPPPSEHGVELPVSAQHVLRKALSKKPEKRYESASKLQARLRALRKEQATGDKGVERRQREHQRIKAERRGRLGQVLGTLGVVGFLGLGGAFWWRAVNRLDQADARHVEVKVVAQGGKAELRWQTAAPVHSELQYGYSPALELLYIEKLPTTNHVVHLRDLQAGRTLHYRVREGADQLGPTRTLELATSWSISAPVVEARAARARVRFTTEYPARPWVAISTREDLRDAMRLRAGAEGSEHDVLLPALEAGTQYHGRLTVAAGERPEETMRFDFRTEEVQAQRLFATPDGAALAVRPLVMGERLLVASEGGQLAALDRGDGRVVWTMQLGGPVREELADDGERLFLRVGDVRLVAVAAADGKLLWEHTMQSAGVGAPAVGQGAVVVATRAPSLLALHPETGAPLWDRALDVTPSTGPAINPGEGAFELVLCGIDGILRGHGPGGRALWTAPFAAQAEQPAFFQGVGVGVVGPKRYMRMRESRKSARIEVGLESGSYAGTLVGETVLIASRDRGLTALDWNAPTKLWDAPLPSGARGTPAALEGRVYSLSGEGALHCLRLGTGEPLYVARLASEATASPVPTQEGCYVATYGGHLYRFRD